MMQYLGTDFPATFALAIFYEAAYREARRVAPRDKPIERETWFYLEAGCALRETKLAFVRRRETLSVLADAQRREADACVADLLTYAKTGAWPLAVTDRAGRALAERIVEQVEAWLIDRFDGGR